MSWKIGFILIELLLILLKVIISFVYSTLLQGFLKKWGKKFVRSLKIHWMKIIKAEQFLLNWFLFKSFRTVVAVTKFFSSYGDPFAPMRLPYPLSHLRVNQASVLSFICFFGGQVVPLSHNLYLMVVNGASKQHGSFRS